MSRAARTPVSAKACAFGLALLLLVVASFASLDLQWRALLSAAAVNDMARFVGEFHPPDLSSAFLQRVAAGAVETLAMSALGTLLASAAGLALAVPASRRHRGALSLTRTPTRLLLNVLRSIPDLVWAALLLVAAGLGPLAGTLALALHTTGVLGRLFAEALENAPPGPAEALEVQGVRPALVLLYATLPQILPQLIAYTLYRWENNIRAATVLGVVGAGGLGQLLMFHMGLFQMGKTATLIGAMLLLVSLVDALSVWLRHRLMR